MNLFDLVLDPIKVPGIIAAKLWIREGSRADPKHQKGIHQLLGSLLSRGCGPYNNVALADLVEGCGAGLRCDTLEDGLLISLKCTDCDAMRLLPVLGWMITDAHLEDQQIKLERELSLQALKRQKENPFHIAFDGWRQLAYQEGPYGHDPLGLTKDLKGLGQIELAPLSQSLISRRIVLSISGAISQNIEHELMQVEPFRNLSNQSSNNWLERNLKNYSEITPKPYDQIKLQNQTTGQVVIMLGQATIPHGHKDDIALRLLSCHMGTGMSSSLFKSLREEHGVAYDVGVHHPIRERNSPFLFHASTSEEKALLTLQLLKQSWWNLGVNAISDQDLMLAKAKFKGQLAHDCQTTAQRAEKKAQIRGFLLDDDHDKECLSKVEKLTAEDLQKVAIRHLQAPLLSLCGPKSTLKKLAADWAH